MGPARGKATFPDDVESPPLLIALPLFALIALLGDGAGTVFRYPDVGSAVLYSPYAALTAALLAARRREWGWYFLVGAAIHVATHWPHWSLSWVLLADVANIARALCAAVLLRRLFGGTPRLEDIRSLLLFIAVAVLVAPAVGAFLGAGVVNLLSTHGYWVPWRAWFVSNALTGLTLLPALLPVFTGLARARAPYLRGRRLVEPLLLAAAVAASCAVAFLYPSDGPWPLALPFYAPLPALIWAALRFGPSGSSLALTGVLFAAIWGAGHGTGPFLASSPDDNVIALQVFVLLMALPVLCIAAVDSARLRVAELHRALMSSVHDHVAFLDARGVVFEANDSWRPFAGGPDGKASGDVGPGQDFLAVCRDAADQGTVAARQALLGLMTVLGRKQSRFEMEYEDESRGEAYALTVEALARPDGGAVVRRTDTSARRRAQREIEEQRRELSHLSRVALVGQLSGALAHELSQPLTAILTNADAARRLLARTPLDVAELSEILQDIATEDRRAADVIQHLRAFYKRGETQMQRVNTVELVGEVLTLTHAEMIGRGIAATMSFDRELPPVKGDRVQLQQVLLNLVLNACDAMSGAGGRTLSLTVRADGRHAHFAVRDQGSGIAPEMIEQIFEPFVTTKPDGLGLGLSISRTIIEAHGGRLWAENNADGGATVHCLVPLDETPRADSARWRPEEGVAAGAP